MFRLKRKSKKNISYQKKLSIVVILLMLLLPLGKVNLYSYAATTESKKICIKESVEKGKFFAKTYTLDINTACSLVAKIKAKGIGTNLRLTIYGDCPDYFLGHNDLPVKILEKDAKGNVGGVLRTNHIMMADRYHLVVQSVNAIQENRTIELDFECKKIGVEDCDYSKIYLNNTKATATDFNIKNKKTHKFLLSGFREQKDISDYYKIHINKAGYLSLRFRTISNTGNVPFSLCMHSASKNKPYVVFKNPGKKLKAKLMKVTSGDYYLKVLANNSIKNHQIVYSLSVSKTESIKSVSINRKRLSLYCLQGYTTGKLISKVNGKKSNSNNVVFRSSRSNVVSVSKAGKLTAKKPGKATITCYAIDKPSVKATCVVTVKNPRLTLKERAKGLYVGDRTRLSVKKMPHTLSVTWKSSNPKVASISSDGTVHGKTAGSAKIYAVSKHGIKSKSCVITVRKKPQPKPKPTPDPKKDPTNQDNHNDTIVPALSLSSAHLSPRGTMLVTANVVGGRFSVSGGISIQSKSGKSCVIKAITSRGTGTIAYTVNGKTASKHIVIY